LTPIPSTSYDLERMKQAPILALLASSLASAAPTFTKDVAPIFHRRCVQCHRPNDIAPMSLLDYKSARPWAKAIRESVLSRKMPPWFADPHYGSFANDARLSTQEIETIQAWVDAGAVEGSPRDLPPAPVFVEGWKQGKPDIVIDIGEDFVVKPGADDYEHFVVPTNFREGVWVRAAEIRPGNRNVVHHVHVTIVRDENEAGSTSIESMTALNQYLIHDGKLTRIRQDAPVLDNACAANAPDLPYIHGFQEGGLAAFLPGRPPDVFPEGSAKWVPPGAKLEFTIHYARIEGQPQTDRTRVGLYLAPGPPEKVLRRMDLRNFFFRLPPGDSNHEVKRCYTFEKDKMLISITPHMHYRGKDAQYEIVRPDGRREILLSVPHYNFGWQLVYRFQDPIRVEKGSQLIVTAHYDNSPNNRANPDPTETIRWGDKSEEEMMTSWIEYIDAAPAQVVSESGRR
jgi:Copper type II ascorbate-dependent monooxygenase, C-terminal domain